MEKTQADMAGVRRPRALATGAAGRCAALLLCLAALLPPAASAATEDELVDAAMAQVGQPYVDGGNAPGGFDCSGLVRYVFGQVGVDLPRTTLLQRQAGARVSFEQARTGDLLFYRFTRRGKATNHVAIYLGDGRAVHAGITGKQVRVAKVDNRYWRKRLQAAIRVLPGVTGDAGNDAGAGVQGVIAAKGTRFDPS